LKKGLKYFFFVFLYLNIFFSCLFIKVRVLERNWRDQWKREGRKRKEKREREIGKTGKEKRERNWKVGQEREGGMRV